MTASAGSAASSTSWRLDSPQRLRAFGDWIEPSEEVAYDRANSDNLAARHHVGYGSVADLDTAYRAVLGRVHGVRDECAAVLGRAGPAAGTPGREDRVVAAGR